MNFFKKISTYKSSLVFSSLAILSMQISTFKGEVKAYPVIVEECASGQIPTAVEGCLVDPISYKLDIYRVYICRSDPFLSLIHI